MQLPSLMTHEVGSLAKPLWRVKAFSGKTLQDSDIESAKNWASRLNVESKQLIELLKKRKDFTAEEKAIILHFSSLLATRLLEQAGLDLVWDGEQHRIEMYEHVIQNVKGFVCKGHVRSFDNKYYEKASCVSHPTMEKPLHLDEYDRIIKFAQKPLKVPVTGAYTLVDWSFDEFFAKNIIPGAQNVNQNRLEGRQRFLNEIARKIIHPTLKALYAKGAKFLQIDEAAAATKRAEIQEFIDTTKESVGDLAGKAFLSMHLCFSEYERLFPAIKQLEGILNAVHLECANRDTTELGVSQSKRTGYEILKKFKDTDFIIGIGVCDVHTDFIEPPELIRDRILYACEILGDPKRIMVAPDCGLRTRTWDVAFAKLSNLVKGKELARTLPLSQ